MNAEVRTDKRIRKIYLSPGANFPVLKTKGEYQDFLKTTFSYMIDTERKSVQTAIESLPDGELSPEHHAFAHKALMRLFSQKCISYGIRWPAFFLSVLGIWYIIVKLI